MRRAGGALVLGLLIVPAAHATTVVALGDSITWGVTRGAQPPATFARDPAGGYPARLATILGDGTRVLNRGIGGTTTSDWLARPRGTAAELARRLAAWPEFRPARDPAPNESFAAWVLAADRPDVVLLLLGVNDLERARLDGKPIRPHAIAARIVKVAHQARAAAPRVLVATLLPNRRDPAEAIEAVNARLCALEPTCVRLDRGFMEAGGTALLADEVHPNEGGYAVIARLFAAALARGPERGRRHVEAFPPISVDRRRRAALGGTAVCAA